jgi:hypothetical protein
MRYRNIIVFLGFVIVVIQFLGFPQSWDEIFYVASGALIIAFGYLAGKDRRPVHVSVPKAAEPLEKTS